MPLTESLSKSALGFTILCVFSWAGDVGIATAQSTSDCKVGLLMDLSLALQREQLVKKDFEDDRVSANTVKKLTDAAGSLDTVLERLDDCSILDADTASLCDSKASDAKRLDSYLATVAKRGVEATNRPFASITFIPFLDDRETQLNLLNRSIELKKDCLQALITKGVVDGNEVPPQSQLP